MAISRKAGFGAPQAAGLELHLHGSTGDRCSAAILNTDPKRGFRDRRRRAKQEKRNQDFDEAIHQHDHFMQLVCMSMELFGALARLPPRAAARETAFHEVSASLLPAWIPVGRQHTGRK